MTHDEAIELIEKLPVDMNWRTNLQQIQKTWVEENNFFEQCQVPEFGGLLKRNRAELLNDHPMEWYVEDFRSAAIQLGVYSSEYLADQLYKYSTEEREHLIPTGLRVRFIDSKINEKDIAIVLGAKWVFNTIWSDYIGRPWYRIKKDRCSKQEFISRLHGIHKVIIKPNRGSCGRNIGVRDVGDDRELEALFDELIREDGDYIVEECVIQKGLLGSFNSDTANTVRVNTLRDETGVKVVYSFLRVGRKGCVVDNLHANGIMFPINLETGEIRYGTDKYGIEYESHPDSGVRIKGEIIPYWEKVCRMCSEAHLLAPKNLNWIGWDVCISDDRIVFLEANTRSMLSSRPEDKLFDIFGKYIDEHPVLPKENVFILKDMTVNKNRCEYGFMMRGPWKKYFSRKKLMTKYPCDLSGVPADIMIIPLLGTILPLAWRTNALVVVPWCYRKYLDRMEKCRRSFMERFPEIDFEYRFYATSFEETGYEESGPEMSITHSYDDLKAINCLSPGTGQFEIRSNYRFVFEMDEEAKNELSPGEGTDWFEDFQRDIAISSHAAVLSYLLGGKWEIEAPGVTDGK